MSACNNCIKHYHDNFHGDTYDACARCGGKCEQFKISSLMPDEKAFMAEKLKLSVKALEDKYLSRIDTPYGQVDVLKMKDGCNFLDERFHCTAIPAKPVLCDTYPIVFSLSKRKVHFEIDQRDCPMVHWKEYDKAVEAFATKGIETLKQLKVPLSWWRMVALYDEFDVNYVEIDKQLAKSRGYETFLLEHILGYACNGYERKARRRGFDLLIIRLRNLKKKAFRRLDSLSAAQPAKIRKLAAAYKNILSSGIDDAIAYLRSQKAIPVVLTEPVPNRYMEAVNQGFRILRLMENTSRSSARRLKLVRKYARARRPGKFDRASEISSIHNDFQVAIPEGIPPLRFTEISSPNSPEFWESLALLAATFLPNELDEPECYITELKSIGNHRGKKTTLREDPAGPVTFWSKWVMVCAKDESGRLLGTADGALVVNRDTALFYFSHIAVVPSSRVKGIGTALTAATLQAADNAIPAAWKSLGVQHKKATNGRHLDCELTEIEFADLSFTGAATIKRMPFHGRLGRQAIWPLRYSQPDTDYSLPNLEEKYWNSVPMFLAYRSFPAKNGSVENAVDAAMLMFDYFIYSNGPGAKWDKDYLLKGLDSDGKPSLIPFPVGNADLQAFIGHTGTLGELLKKYYPGHTFTRDFLNE